MQPPSHQNVGAWLRSFAPSFPLNSISKPDPISDQSIRQAVDLMCPGADLPRRIPYQPTGYTLSDLVAGIAAHKSGAVAQGFQARLVNSGMAALHSALGVAALTKPLQIHAPEGMSLLTEELIRSFEAFGMSVRFSRANAWILNVYGSPIMENDDDDTKDVLIAESVGYGPEKVLIDLEQFLYDMWATQAVLILDNTVPTVAMHNPFVAWAKVRSRFGSAPTMRMIVVESLSHTYRCVPDQDPVSAGIIYAPSEWIAEVDRHIAVTGTYLPLASLLQLPFDLHAAAHRILPSVSATAKKVAERLSTNHDYTDISYADPTLFPNGAGSLITFRYAGVNDHDMAFQILHRRLGLPTESFGHPQTTWTLWPTTPPGTIRLSVGTQDTADAILQRLNV